MAMLIITSLVLASCNVKEDSSLLNGEPETFSIKEYTDETGDVREIYDVDNYIKELSKKAPYSDVATEMTILGISEDEYVSSTLINPIDNIRITTKYVEMEEEIMDNELTPSLSNAEFTVIGSNDTTEKFNGIKITTVVSSVNLTLGNVSQPVFRVKGTIEWVNTAPSNYTDIVDVFGDYDLLPLVSSSHVNFADYNKMVIVNNDDTETTITSFATNISNISSTFSFNKNSYPNAKSITIHREFRLGDVTEVPLNDSKYFAFTIGYAKATKSISMSTIGFSAGVGGSGAFVGLNFGFTSKKDFEIVTTTTGIWMTNKQTEIAEGVAYKIQCEKTVGLIFQWGLYPRYMMVKSSSINDNAEVYSTVNSSSYAQQFTFIRVSSGGSVYWEIAPYHILGYRLSVEGTSIRMTPASNANSQKFKIEKINATYYKIVPYSDSTKCVAVDGNGNAIVTDYSSTSAKHWKFNAQAISNAPIDYFSYGIKNKNSGLFCDSEGGLPANASDSKFIIQYDFHGANNQLFELVYVNGTGNYQFKIPNTVHRIRVETGNGNIDGAKVKLYNGTTTDTPSLFKIVRVTSDGYYKILTKFSGYEKCWSVENVSFDSGSKVHQWTFEATTSEQNRDNNLWKFV